jgi:hypothetical protein
MSTLLSVISGRLFEIAQVFHLGEITFGAVVTGVPGMRLNLLDSHALIGINLDHSSDKVFGLIRDVAPSRCFESVVTSLNHFKELEVIFMEERRGTT